MKLIIAGSRDLEICGEHICDYLDYFQLNPEEIVTGNSGNVDKAGNEFAEDNFRYSQYEKCSYILTLFSPDWNKHGKAAGPIRNREMAQYSDALLIVWNGESRGSKNMKEEMLKLDKPVYEIVLRKYNT